MNNSPEGLDYGNTNTAHRHDCADKLEAHLEKGKMMTGAIGHHEHDRAGLERMLSRGSYDPYHANNKKNK